MSKAFKTLAEIREALLSTPRRRSIIPGVLPVGTGFFYGDSGVGKTGLIVRTALAIAGGLAWADRHTTRGSVLYVAGEDYSGVSERMVAAAGFLNLDIAALPVAVMRCPEKGLVDNIARQEVANAAKALVADTALAMSLIVFDTLATCFGNDNQDDATAAGKFLKNAERLSQDFECAVLTVHHTGKSGAGKGMRGSNVFHANADCRAILQREKSATIVRVEKMRNEPDGARFAFDITGTDLEVAGGPISVQVVRNLNAWSPAESTTKDEDRARREFTDAATALGLLHKVAIEGSASLKDWQDACYAHWTHKPSDGSRRTAFSTVRKKLHQDGEIVIVGDTVSVSVSEKPANNVPNNTSPDTVSVSVSTTPSKRGVHTRTDSRKTGGLQKQTGDFVPDVPTDSGVPIGKANAFPRGAGAGSPARGHGAGANADADIPLARTGTEG